MKSWFLGTKPAKESITGLPTLNKLVGQKAHVKPEDRERKAKPLPSKNKEANMKTLGIDVGKDSFSIAVISPEGELVAKLSCNLNSDGIESLRKSICPSDKVAVEASGPYSSIITAHIQNMGITPYLVNPLLAARFKQANSLRKTKTDSIDAISIARLSQSSSLQPAQGYLKEGIRLLERQIEATSRQIASLKNSILQTLHFLFPELEREFDPFSKGILKLLSKFPSAWAIAKATTEEIEDCFPSRGRKIDIQKLIKLAQNSVGIPDPSREAVLKALITQLLCLIDIREELKHKLEEEVERLYQQELELIKTIPGFGSLTSSSFIAEVGDISRFSSAKKLTAYAGLDPSVYQSGRFTGKSHISKRGNRHLRRLLFICAQQAVRSSPTFRNYFLRLRAKGKSYRQAMVATSSKLLRVTYAVLSSGRPFCENPIS